MLVQVVDVLQFLFQLCIHFCKSRIWSPRWICVLLLISVSVTKTENGFSIPATLRLAWIPSVMLCPLERWINYWPEAGNYFSIQVNVQDFGLTAVKGFKYKSPSQTACFWLFLSVWNTFWLFSFVFIPAVCFYPEVTQNLGAKQKK